MRLHHCINTDSAHGTGQPTCCPNVGGHPNFLNRQLGDLHNIPQLRVSNLYERLSPPMSRTQVAFWRSTIQPSAPATSKARNSTHLQALRRMCLPHSPNTLPNHVSWPLAVWFLALFRALIRTPGNLPML